MERSTNEDLKGTDRRTQFCETATRRAIGAHDPMLDSVLFFRPPGLKLCFPENCSMPCTPELKLGAGCMPVALGVKTSGHTSQQTDKRRLVVAEGCYWMVVSLRSCQCLRVRSPIPDLTIPAWTPGRQLGGGRQLQWCCWRRNRVDHVGSHFRSRDIAQRVNGMLNLPGNLHGVRWHAGRAPLNGLIRSPVSHVAGYWLQAAGPPRRGIRRSVPLSSRSGAVLAISVAPAS